MAFTRTDCSVQICKMSLLILLIIFAVRSGAHSKFLQKLILPVIPIEECKSKFGDYLGIQNITQKQICAGGIKAKFRIFIPYTRVNSWKFDEKKIMIDKVFNVCWNHALLILYRSSNFQQMLNNFVRCDFFHQTLRDWSTRFACLVTFSYGL